MRQRGASEPPRHKRGAAAQSRAGPGPRLDLEQTLGSVDESREEHLKRCQQPRCPRCRFYNFGPNWQATYGSITEDAEPRSKTIWLSERPSRWKGVWALGCTLCAEALRKQQLAAEESSKRQQDGMEAEGSSKKKTGRGNCKWARFEVRPANLQAEHVKQHACSDYHKLAEHAFLRPDVPMRLYLQKDHSDDKLLHGAVPQPKDWVRVWRWAIEGTSWASAERFSVTDNWLDQLRGTSTIRRRAIRNMSIVMREVIRARKREQIRAASCLSISFDDRKAYKLIKVHYDVPLRLRGGSLRTRPSDEPSQIPWAGGVIGCLDIVHNESKVALDQDYGEHQVAKIIEMIKKFCTPMGAELDKDIYDKIRLATRSIIVDGALLKTAYLLKQRFFQKVILIGRDPAHMVRTGVADPLIRTGKFEKQHEMLFSGKRALLKTIQHSELFQARLQACQRDIVEEHGSQGGGLVNVLRHFSFAPHRWESFAGPRRQYCCMLLAMYKCLGEIAGGWRVDQDRRKHALKCMDEMSGAHAVEVGVSADYAEACMRFIRLWDKSDKDPATSAKDISDFKYLINTLFVDGYILCTPGISGGLASDEREAHFASLGNIAGHRSRTITQITYEQLKLAENMPIVVQGIPRRMWWRGSKHEVLNMMVQVKGVVRDALARLEADFSPNSLYLCFEVFDLAAWHTIMHSDQNRYDSPQSQKLLTKGKILFKALGLEWKERSFYKAVQIVLGCRSLVTSATPKHVRNRATWAAALAASQGHDPICEKDELLWAEPALRFYWSYRDGTGDVERLLGSHLRFERGHPAADQNDDSTEICMELKAAGPRHEGEIAEHGEGGVLLLTDFSRECAKLWREFFGTRFASRPSRRKDVGRRFEEKLVGSFKAVRVQHNVAVKRLLKDARLDEQDPAAKKSRCTIFGFRRDEVDPIQAEDPVEKTKLFAFTERTKAIQKEKSEHSVWTGCESTFRLRHKVKPGRQTPMQKIRAAAIRIVERQKANAKKLKHCVSLRGNLARHRASKPIPASASSRSRAPSRASAPSQSSAANAASSSTSSSSSMRRISSPAAKVTAGRPHVPDLVKAYRRVQAAKEEKKSAKNRTK